VALRVIEVLPVEVDRKLPEVYQGLLNDTSRKEGEVEIAGKKGR
jgi:hypothetical protein